MSTIDGAIKIPTLYNNIINNIIKNIINNIINNNERIAEERNKAHDA